MIAAPVGFQCPSCVAEAAARVPRTRTAVGGIARAQPRRATTFLIGLNVVLYVFTLLSGDRLVVEYGMFGAAVASGEWWRLMTAPFLHAGLWHVGLNMLALWVLGGVVEPLLGRWRFVAVYLVSALGGTVTSYALTGPGVISVGASGAVFGLLGSTLVVMRRLNRDVSGVVVLLLINLVLGFVLPNIDWRAHLGGFIAGALLMLIMVSTPRRVASAATWGGVAALLALMAAVVGWRTDQLVSLLF